MSLSHLLVCCLLVAVYLSSLSNAGFNMRGGRGRGHRSKDTIPVQLDGGICGQGENYTYFIRPGQSAYVAFVFEGLGFCYDDATCSDANTVIDLDEYIAILDDSIQFSNSKPFDTRSLTWTLVLFPQCTEDYHIGSSDIDFGGVTGNFHFRGGDNVDLVIGSILNDTDGSVINEHVDFDEVEHLVMLGSSSGAYGAAFWGNTIFEYIPEDALKTLIIDSWWLNNSMATGIIPSLVTLFNVENSPAVSDELVDLIQAGDILTMPTVMASNLEKYCDLFVSFLYYDADNILPYFHYTFTSDVSWFNEAFYTSTFNTDITERERYTSLDSKRVSSYVAEAEGHIMFLDGNWTTLGTKCDEAPLVQEYISDVVGGRSLVRKYYGQPTHRVRSWPKSWNTVDIECLECA